MKTATAALPPAGKKAALAARVAIVVNGGLAIAFVALWLHLAIQGSFWKSDFTAYYIGGRLVLQREGEHFYDFETQGAAQARWWPQRGGAEALLPLNYPPHSALLWAPLTLLPPLASFYAWTLINLGLLAVLLLHVRRITADWQPLARAAAVATVLGFPPLFINFQVGQASLLGLICLVGFYEGLRRDRWWAAAAWLVLGTVKPQLMLIPAATLVAGRRWRALATAAGLFGLWALVTTVVLGPRCWLDFLDIVAFCTRQFGTYGIHPLAMYNVKGFLTVLLGSEHAPLINALTAIGAGASLLFTLWLWWGPWPGDTPVFARRAALTLLVGLLTNPHLNPGDALAFVAPALLLTDVLAPGPARRRLALAAMAAPLLFLLDVYGPGSRAGYVRPFFVCVVVWTGWLAWDTLASRRTGRDRVAGAYIASAGAGN